MSVRRQVAARPTSHDEDAPAPPTLPGGEQGKGFVGSLIRSPREFGAGLIHVGFGLVAVWIGRDYTIGTGARMGPGFFPTTLGALLLVVGLVALVRSFLIAGDPIGRVAWKPLFLVTLGTLLFAYLLPRTGLVVALGALALVGAAASERFRLEWRPALGLAALIAVCVLVFVMGLRVPLPLLGSWLGVE